MSLQSTEPATARYSAPADVSNPDKTRAAQLQEIPRPSTIWLTGLSGAGKTTVATSLHELLAESGSPSCLIDGDELRVGLSRDLGFGRADRAEQARRAAEVALLLGASEIVALVALVSPYEADRYVARALHVERAIPFFEVWLDTPLAVCAQRDPKGLYAEATSGQRAGFTGIGAPYEPPVRPDLHLRGDGASSKDLACQIIDAAAKQLGRRAPSLLG